MVVYMPRLLRHVGLWSQLEDARGEEGRKGGVSVQYTMLSEEQVQQKIELPGFFRKRDENN